MTQLSCHHFRSNEVRLWLSVLLAYNLGNLWRRLFGGMLRRMHPGCTFEPLSLPSCDLG